ncbi:hypothetical protein CYMTET_8796 [Cymbomonas tetramitiformis]|uniref:Uncharacterized protein n=1 Tax=Cymbomonas tetramitiformis TaxID=36881 RepID=A0AAE0GSK6_9CHLO|nr:hypothetical protein CYMTET_8796 [Cymbomonas tetramitiformis]
MREYNIMHRFPKHKMGITTEEWLKLPEAKQQQVAASAEVKDRLAAELSSLQAVGPADGGKGAEAQARSEDGDDEAEYDSNFNEREEYAVDERVGAAGEIAAILLAQRAIDLPKDIDNLLALEEIEGKEPTEPVRHPTEVNVHQCEDTPGTVAQEMKNGAATCPEQSDDKELPLDEMPDGVVDHTTARCAAAACVSESVWGGGLQWADGVAVPAFTCAA